MSEPALNVGIGDKLDSFHQCLVEFVARPGLGRPQSRLDL